MFGRCESDWGAGNCEECHRRLYPKCRSGYHAAGCNICQPDTPDCGTLGYSTAVIHVFLSCPKKTIIGDPTPLECASGLKDDAGFCYTPCPSGFSGTGLLCLQSCDSSTTNYGFGCASNFEACAFYTANQVILPLVIAANIATLGLAETPDAAAEDTVRIGSKSFTATTNIGKGMLWLVKKLQSVTAHDLPENASLVERIWKVRSHGPLFFGYLFLPKSTP